MIRNKKRSRRLVLMLGAGVLAAGLMLCGCTGGDQPDTASGIAYLESLEQQDPGEVDAILRQRRLAELEEQRVETLARVKAGEQDPFTVFQDAVILGDSRAVGFFYYGFVDESRDLTGTGDTILNIPKKLDILEEMNPRYIYLTYGLNDIKIGYWSSLEAHIADYLDYVRQIRERVPDSVVVISSVLPFQDPDNPNAAATFKPSSGSTLTEADIRRLTKIPEWNELMKAACAEAGVIFVDNSAICSELKHLWEPDGIHVVKAFYPHWGKNLVVAALEEGGIADESSPA